ncbi:D-alanyl-D-alanine carboxypeptidase/D-alanyl-D-alanine endopeptidase [Aquabacterium sp.]|uniref:D-alanyl-D-alanine carboxypeptidase/D-alanyl-D-alanine endopeptidase n=1 Tax=Aquabacterium sp. TaxID=1872578 RepID=UPI002C7F369C|nr:D-alanyl-D-alanine carboxypeptidase/D-alanyl-D-alanine-endopeptidase [Aquabacterium sp.]HSW03836.1 D-alanyl-D-alanine carboxypeptidase/D-alanyl-D-alanine-endopeptidase [Aquabacterium sp.]
MLRLLIILFAALSALPLAAAGPTAPVATLPVPVAKLPAPVARALREAGLPSDALAMMVAPAGRAGRPFAHQPDRPMQPGSTMKLVTSVVALDRLGPNHRGFTELFITAAPQQSVLPGDLVLRGGADPELGLPQLWQLLAELRWSGVQEIGGDIVLDRSLFRPARPDQGVPPFDEAPEFPYNVVPDALTINGSLMGLELRADDVIVQARLLPPLDGIVLDNQLALNDRACSEWDEDWRTPLVQPLADGRVSLLLQGSFPRRCTQRTALQLLDRNQQAERQLRLIWHSLGGVWRGSVRNGVLPDGARLVARHESRPWGELLRQQNKQSDNLLARLLYLSLGVAAMPGEPEATTQALAEREVRRWFDEQRIDTRGLVLDNGSGLSRSERITPRQMVRLLQAAHQGRQASELMMSLPVAGVDGTLRNRLKTSPAAGWARLKTGTLRNVAALAGYVPDAQGRLWVVVAMVNHDDAKRGRSALDALVDWVARSGFNSARGVGPRARLP